MGHEFILAFAAFLLFYQFGMRYVITYHLTNIRLEVRLFGFLPVSMTRYDLIDEVRINDYLKAFAWPIRVWMVNRLVGSFVVVRRGGLPSLYPRRSRESSPGSLALTSKNGPGSGPWCRSGPCHLREPTPENAVTTNFVESPF